MGAIGPKKKRSIEKRNIRHATWETDILKKLSNMMSFSLCTNCGATRLAHRVCKKCGYYKGKQVLTIKTKTAKVIDA